MRKLTFPEIFPVYPLALLGSISAFVIAPYHTFTALWAAAMIGLVLYLGVSAGRDGTRP